MSALRPFFSFYGAKWRAALYYPRPQYDSIIEPFSGSAGYSLRYPEHDVLLIDEDEVIAGTWQYLIKVSEREIRSLPLLGPDDHIMNLQMIPEARWLIGWWLNKGMTAPCLRPSQWMRNPLPGRLETYWGAGVRERIARQLEFIRHWRVQCGSYSSAPDLQATWFVDPPYVGPPGRRYRISNRRIDYSQLAEWCRGRRGQVMVCENVGASWLPFKPFVDAKAMAGSKRTGKSAEALWLSDQEAEAS